MGAHLCIAQVRVCALQRLRRRIQEACSHVGLRCEGCVPQLAAVVALHKKVHVWLDQMS